MKQQRDEYLAEAKAIELNGHSHRKQRRKECLEEAHQLKPEQPEDDLVSVEPLRSTSTPHSDDLIRMDRIMGSDAVDKVRRKKHVGLTQHPHAGFFPPHRMAFCRLAPSADSPSIT